MTRLLVSTLLFWAAFAQPVLPETYLLMAEEDGCVWCARWNEEIAHIYPKTAEGKTAPLKRFDVHHDKVNDVVFAQPVYFTPTFLLIKDGAELGRIEGYPGEDFFWGLLAQMFQRAGVAIEEASGS